MAPSPPRFSQRLTNLVAGVVVAVWAGSMLADALFERYDPPVSVHAAFMAVVGALFGASVFRNGGKR